MDLHDIVEQITGQPVRSTASVGGGDIGESATATLADDTRVFVKHYPDALPEAVRREAEGLRWLTEPGVIPVATVRGFDEEQRVLVLDWIEPGRSSALGDAEFGHALAELHRSGAPAFGALADNFIGSLPQSNRDHTTWATFFGAERIAPQVELATASGRLTAADAELAAQVIERSETLFDPGEPPSRLHGDLWGGNRLCDTDGRSWLIDPAAYGGHREMDLAMMRLFGGFSNVVFDAYEEAWPLATGADERIELCQLYPVLVHVNLFGGHYAESARSTLRRYA